MMKDSKAHSDIHPISDIVVNLLRDIRNQDPEAFAFLVAWRTNVNAKLASHPVLPTSANRGKAQLSLVGLLNGILLAANAQKVAAVVDNDVIVGFTLLDKMPEDLGHLQEASSAPQAAGMPA